MFQIMEIVDASETEESEEKRVEDRLMETQISNEDLKKAVALVEKGTSKNQVKRLFPGLGKYMLNA